MGKKQYQPFFWGDYLKDTQQLSLAEHGAYLRLIGEYWNTGRPLPKDAERMRRACGAHTETDAEALRYVLQTYFKDEGDVWRHPRIDEQLAEHNAHIEKAKEAARVAANARWGNTPSNANAMRTASEPHANYSTPLHSTQKENIKTPTPIVGEGSVRGVFQSEKIGGEFRIEHYLSEASLQAARSIAPNWDVYHLMGIYDENIRKGTHERPKDPNRAFPAWCARYTKGGNPK